MDLYVLIDLERGIKSGVMHYWRRDKRGYTTDPKEAGIYSEEEAVKAVESDMDGTTVKLELEKFARLLS